MWFFKKVSIAVFFVIFATQSYAESNLEVVLSDVKKNNNIYALDYLIQQSETDSGFYQKINMSEAEFNAFKQLACQTSFLNNKIKLAHEIKDLELICGVEISVVQ